MSRSIDAPEIDRKEEKPEGGSSFDGLSRSGSQERPKASIDAVASPAFGENRRERIVYREREYRIRPSESELLRELGVFQVIRESDAVNGIYGGDESLLRADVRSLRRQDLVRSVAFNTLRGGPTRVFMLSRSGYELVNSRGGSPQFIYWGGKVKAAEVEHDSLLYRAYLREKEQILRGGGAIKRVRLFPELMRDHYSRLFKPGASRAAVLAETAAKLHLPVRDGHVVFPDFRIEYENERGEPARVDVEVATGNYRESQIAQKSAAGFRVYSSAGSGGGARVQQGERLKGRAFPDHTAVMPL